MWFRSGWHLSFALAISSLVRPHVSHRDKAFSFPLFQSSSVREMFWFLTRSCPFSTFSMAWYRSYIVFSAYNGFVTHEKTHSESCAHVWVRACAAATMWVPAHASKKGCSYLHLQLHNREHLRSVCARARSPTLWEPLWVALRFCVCVCVCLYIL